MRSEDFRIGWRATKITVPAALSGITATVVVATATVDNIVSRAAGSWIDDTVEIGDSITFTGFEGAANNVTFTVTKVEALALYGTTAAAMLAVAGDAGVGGLIGTRAVKLDRCRLGRIRVLTGAITITPYDDTVAMWDTVASTADLDFGDQPLEITHSLKLLFSAAGSAWVHYK